MYHDNYFEWPKIFWINFHKPVPRTLRQPAAAECLHYPHLGVCPANHSAALLGDWEPLHPIASLLPLEVPERLHIPDQYVGDPSNKVQCNCQSRLNSVFLSCFILSIQQSHSYFRPHSFLPLHRKNNWGTEKSRDNRKLVSSVLSLPPWRLEGGRERILGTKLLSRRHSPIIPTLPSCAVLLNLTLLSASKKKSNKWY